MSKQPVSFAALSCLESIVTSLRAEAKPLSATTLRRYYGCDVPAFNDAVLAGCALNVIKKEAWNVLALLDSDWEIDEYHYYPLCMEAVRRLWLGEGYSASEMYSENTSRRDSKIEGPWTRPDFVMVTHKKYPWTVGHDFDVNTFEVKRPKKCNVLAVFEALSHASAATRAFAVFPVNRKDWLASNPAQAKRVTEECSRHGVGLILVEDIHGRPRAIQHIPPTKRAIDHEKCSSFLGAVLSTEGKEQLSKWK